MSWLTRKFGLTIDNLVSAEVVTADGRLLRVTEDENPDLFWAVRGGGGNFGVATSFEFRLHQVDPVVQLALIFWSLDQGQEAMQLTREIVSALPPDINAVFAAVNAPLAPFVLPEHHFSPGYALLLTGFGSAAEHADLAAQIRRRVPPLFDLETPMFYVELQKLFDEANGWGAGLLATERHWARGFWEALNTQAIDGGGGYVNGSSEYSDGGIRRSYGPAKYERLARIKADYDPGNIVPHQREHRSGRSALAGRASRPARRPAGARPASCRCPAFTGPAPG
jgi:FAD/FMN-containing dehydrogenase